MRISNRIALSWTPSRSLTTVPKRTFNRTKAFSIVGLSTVVGAYYFNKKENEPIPMRKSKLDSILEQFEPLSLDAVNGILTTNQKSVTFGYRTLHRVDSSSVNSNTPIEDESSQGYYDNIKIFGVYDGHGGGECSAIVSKYLPNYIAKHIKNLPKDPKPTANGYVPTRKEVFSAAIQEAFLELDADILNGCFDEYAPPKHYFSWSVDVNSLLHHLRPAVAGSCALVAVLDGDDLYVACTGDSRAVLGRSIGEDSYETIELSMDQTPANPNEYDRLIDEHPLELDTVVVRGRILGGLMPSRAFGDARYKWPVSVQEAILPLIGKRGIPRNFKTPPYVTALPEVTHYSLKNLSSGFLVLATDGLFDMLTSEEVVNLTSSYINNKPVQGQAILESMDTASTHLIRNALAGETGILRSTERVQRMLAIPSGQSRRYRDDMTVLVLFLGETKENASKLPDSKTFKKLEIESIAPLNYKKPAVLKSVLNTRLTNKL